MSEVESRLATHIGDLDVEGIYFFTDVAVVTNPYQYFDALRARCPVHPVKHPNVVAVTGDD